MTDIVRSYSCATAGEAAKRPPMHSAACANVRAKLCLQAFDSDCGTAVCWYKRFIVFSVLNAFWLEWNVAVPIVHAAGGVDGD
ncbi:MAG TPA: hypothetical protein VNS29_16265 [Burkholderiaceae bacterium]|nr:hypothetical protein [Burkholderiaceae bacterium]